MPSFSPTHLLLLALLSICACSTQHPTPPQPSPPDHEIRILVGSTATGVHWRLVSDPIETLQELGAVLRRLHGDNAPPIVVDPGPNTTYAEVAQTLDAITEAGFTEISFGTSPRTRR